MLDDNVLAQHLLDNLSALRSISCVEHHSLQASLIELIHLLTLTLVFIIHRHAEQRIYNRLLNSINQVSDNANRSCIQVAVVIDGSVCLLQETYIGFIGEAVQIHYETIKAIDIELIERFLRLNNYNLPCFNRINAS